MTDHKQMLDKVYSLLPRLHRNEDKNNREQLKRFLEIMVEGGLHPLYHETKGLLSLIDFDTVPAEFLPHLASTLGFKFPYDLDEQTQRTYVKNAVVSYKMKGTKQALTFMIRELTRFKTEIEIDEENKALDVYLEVNMNRQDFDRVVEKVAFLIYEYAPPFKTFNLINTFIFIEPRKVLANRATYRGDIITLQTVLEELLDEVEELDLKNDIKLETIIEELGGEFFDEENTSIEPPMEFDTFKATFDLETLEINDIKIYTDFNSAGWFLTNDGILNDPNFLLTALTGQTEDYQIPVKHEEYTEHSLEFKPNAETYINNSEYEALNIDISVNVGDEISDFTKLDDKAINNLTLALTTEIEDYQIPVKHEEYTEHNLKFNPNVETYISNSEYELLNIDISVNAEDEISDFTMLDVTEIDSLTLALNTEIYDIKGITEITPYDIIVISDNDNFTNKANYQEDMLTLTQIDSEISNPDSYFYESYSTVSIYFDHDVTLLNKSNTHELTTSNNVEEYDKNIEVDYFENIIYI